MRWKLLLLAVLVMAGMSSQRNVSAADLALVLLPEWSGSMGEDESKLVKARYRASFSDPAVVAAIAGNGGGVAAANVEFSDESNVRVVKGWDVLPDDSSARAFGDAVAAAPRSSAGN